MTKKMDLVLVGDRMRGGGGISWVCKERERVLGFELVFGLDPIRYRCGFVWVLGW